MSEYIDLIKRGGNEAIKINKPTGTDFHLTDRGSDWLWTVFCIFLLGSIVTILLMFRKPVHERFFYYTVIAPLLTMAIAYFTMASNLGWTPVRALYNYNRVSTQTTHLGIRQIFYVRYIGWFLAMPWPVVHLSLWGDTPFWQICFNVLLTEFFVVCLLVSSLVKSTYKWGYFSFGVAASWVVFISILTTTKNRVKMMNRERYLCFKISAFIAIFLWAIYPISFGLCEGGNVLVVDSEQIFYGALDVLFLCFAVLLFLPISSHAGLDASKYMTHQESHEDAHNIASSPKLSPPASPKPQGQKKVDKLKKTKKISKSKK